MVKKQNPPVGLGLGLAMYLIERVGKARGGRLGYGSFWTHGLELLGGKQAPQLHVRQQWFSKDVLTGTETTHIALSGLAYWPREWAVSHSYGSF